VADTLSAIRADLIACERCPELRRYCTEIARTKRRAYHDHDYWGKPVPGFGDPRARVMMIGLAPAAHGGNRTGRIFTGDRSGDFLFRALHKAGLANQPTSVHLNDGLQLRNTYITAALHCAPPANTPTPPQLDRCRDYLVREITRLTQVRVVVALGKLAHDEYLKTLVGMGRLADRRGCAFGHGAHHDLGAGLPVLIDSYHPSQQNTQTGRLTPAMFDAVFTRVCRLLR
jgi:uracil-DNA glycosylase